MRVLKLETLKPETNFGLAACFSVDQTVIFALANAKKPDSIRVVRQILVLFVEVRILLGLQEKTLNHLTNG